MVSWDEKREEKRERLERVVCISRRDTYAIVGDGSKLRCLPDHVRATVPDDGRRVRTGPGPRLRELHEGAAVTVMPVSTMAWFGEQEYEK